MAWVADACIDGAGVGASTVARLGAGPALWTGVGLAGGVEPLRGRAVGNAPGAPTVVGAPGAGVAVAATVAAADQRANASRSRMSSASQMSSATAAMPAAMEAPAATLPLTLPLALLCIVTHGAILTPV